MKEKYSVDGFLKEQKILNIVRFLAFPLGWLMYYFTAEPFGETVAIILSVIACTGFWVIVLKGQEKGLYDMVAYTLRSELIKVGEPDYALEMKSIGGGLILRFFFINPGEMITRYNKVIYKTLSNLNLSGKSWIVQIATVASEGQIERMRDTLDQELLAEVEKAKEEKRGLFDHREEDDK